MNNREAVASVVGSFKLDTKDSRISYRTVLRILKSTAKTYSAQRIAERGLLYDYNMYSKIDCFELQEQDIVNCDIVAFRRCKTLMKSVKSLPELIYSKIGGSVKNIRTIDDMSDISLIDSNQYIRNTKRKYKLQDEVYGYIGMDNHLYIPDEEIYSVNLELITADTHLIDECSSCSKNKCKSYWDAKFVCPDRLLDAVIKEARQVVAATYASIIRDTNPNGIDKQPTN